MSNYGLQIAAQLQEVQNYLAATSKMALGAVKAVAGDVRGAGDAAQGLNELVQVARDVVSNFTGSQKTWSFLTGEMAKGELLQSSGKPVEWYAATHNVWTGKRLATSKTASDQGALIGQALAASPTLREKNALTPEALDTFKKTLSAQGMDGLNKVWGSFKKGYNKGVEMWDEAVETKKEMHPRFGKIPPALRTYKPTGKVAEPKKLWGSTALAAMVAAFVLFRKQ